VSRLAAAGFKVMLRWLASHSNWARDSSTFRVSRPMELAVLKDWVCIKQLHQLGEVRRRGFN
jgi:hypothetical protein